MRFWLLVIFVLGVAPTPALADPGESPQRAGAPADEQQSQPLNSTPDFLFGRPRGSIGIRGSWLLGRGSSDFYDFVTDQLTLNKGDFNRPSIGTEGAVTIGRRFDIVFGVDYGQSTTNSEYRHLVDNNRLPIEQTTVIRDTQITGGVKYALTDRGRPVGRLAWVPTSFVPFVGAAAGAMYFQLRQSGDFVDYVDYSVFPDVFEASGWAPTVHVFGGVDYRLLRRLYLNVEGRYIWASGDLGRTFVGFERLDLAGFRMAAGINFVFEEAR
jgi:hypothetical protein